MPIIAHQHTWTQVPGGLLCNSGACTAFMSHAILQANLPTISHHAHLDFDSLMNIAWKKSGGA